MVHIVTHPNCAAQVRAIIDTHTATGPYTASGAAAAIVAELRETNPGLLAAWLDEQAVHFMRLAIVARDASQRAHTTRWAAAARFREATQAAGRGDTALLTPFLSMPFTVDGGVRKPLAHLTHDDLVFVADSYRNRAAANAFRAAVMDKLAARVQGGTVADHFTEAQVKALWSSVAA